MQALLELDCIPAGMELFPASMIKIHGHSSNASLTTVTEVLQPRESGSGTLR